MDKIGSPKFEVELLNAEVDAGTKMVLMCKVFSCTSADLSVVADPNGPMIDTVLQINDHNGKLVVQLDLSQFEFETEAGSETETIHAFEYPLTAPLDPGTYAWSAAFFTQNSKNDAFDETSTDFTFIVKPHCIRVVIWDTPAAIECGEQFSIKIGVKCSSECRPDAWVLEVSDHEGENLASVTIGEKVLRDTTALCYTEVQLTAPPSEGLVSWQARASVIDAKIPHTECVTSFNVRAVTASECVLAIEAIDHDSQSPVEGAKVVVHPYKAFTNKCGMAEVRVPKGGYTLFVSGKNYFPFRKECDVQSDTAIRAELTVDKELSDADIWI